MKKITIQTSFIFSIWVITTQLFYAQSIPYQWTRDSSAFINGVLMPNAFSVGDPHIIRGKPFLVDIDGDGDLDAYIGSQGKGVYLYENIGSRTQPRFVLRSANNFTNSGHLFPYHASPCAVDIDGDGDYDMILGYGSDAGYGGTLLYYKNTGNRTTPQWQFVQDTFAKVDVFDYSSPIAYDFDKDGDFDLLVGGGYGDLFFVENIGTRTEPRWGNVIPNYGILGNNYSIDAGWKAAPMVWDYNQDGKPDIFIGNDRGELLGYKNTTFDTTRTPKYHRYQLINQTIAGVNFGWLNYIGAATGDLNGDGKPDFVVSEQFGNTNYYENTSSATDTIPRFAWKSINFFSETLDFGTLTYGSLIQARDVNGDNIVDLLISRDNGLLSLVLSEGAGRWQLKAENLLSRSKPAYGTNRAYFMKNKDKIDIAILGDSLWYYSRVADSAGLPQWRFRNRYKKPDIGHYGGGMVVGDLDGDGRDDILFNNWSSRNPQGFKYYIFKNCTTTDSLCWRIDSFEMPHLRYGRGLEGDYNLVDLDGDGDLDMLNPKSFSQGLWLKNTGTRTQARFQFETDATLKPFDKLVSYPIYPTSMTFGNGFNQGGLDAFFGMTDGGIVAFKSRLCASTPPTPTSTGKTCTDFMTDTIPLLTWTNTASSYEVKVEDTYGNVWTYCTSLPFIKPVTSISEGQLYHWSVRSVVDSCGSCKSPFSEVRYFYMRPKITGSIFCNNDSVYLTLKAHGADSIQWFYNGVAIPAATKDAYFAKLAGHYTVRFMRRDAPEMCGILRFETDTFIVGKPSVRNIQANCVKDTIQFRANIQNIGNSSYRIDWYRNTDFSPFANGTYITLPREPVGNKIYCRIMAYSCRNGSTLTLNSDTLTVNRCITSTSEFNISAWTVSPNPANHFLNLRFDALKPQNVTVEIHNFLGQTVLQKNFGELVGKQDLVLDVAHLATGLYVVDIRGQSILMRRVLIQR